MRRDSLVNNILREYLKKHYKVYNNQTMAQASFIFHTPQIQPLLRSTYLPRSAMVFFRVLWRSRYDSTPVHSDIFRYIFRPKNIDQTQLPVK